LLAIWKFGRPSPADGVDAGDGEGLVAEFGVGHFDGRDVSRPKGILRGVILGLSSRSDLSMHSGHAKTAALREDERYSRPRTVTRLLRSIIQSIGPRSAFRAPLPARVSVSRHAHV
jgi:hypothetical protein